MLKENVSNIYSDLLEQYNIFLDGDKSNRSLCSRAKNIYQVLDPFFGNIKDELLTNRFNFSSVLYSTTTDKPIAKLLENVFIKPSCITENEGSTFDRAVSGYLYLILIKQCTALTVNDLIKLLRTVLVVDIEDKDIKELTSWYLDSLSGVISYLQDNIKKRGEDTNPAYPIEIHYEPDLEQIGVTFIYRK